MKYETKITLYNSYFDKNDRLTIKSILAIFQDVASIHAERIGVGYKAMLEKDLYWILLRIKFDIVRMPEINEVVTIQTWPHEKGIIDFDRDMKILDENGNVLIIATSKWCVINTTSRSIQRTNNVNYNGECCLDVNYQDRFDKINVPEGEYIKKFDYLVNFSDLDHNQHMNNTNYANLIVNAIDNKYVSHFQINYLNECRENDVIEVSTLKNEDGEYIIGKIKDKIAFIAYLK